MLNTRGKVDRSTDSLKDRAAAMVSQPQRALDMSDATQCFQDKVNGQLSKGSFNPNKKSLSAHNH